MTSRLNCGIVFISMPKMESESKERAIIGNDIIKPNINKFVNKIYRIAHDARAWIKSPSGTTARELDVN